MTWKFECPSGWRILQPWGEGLALEQIGGGLRVVVDCSIKADGADCISITMPDGTRYEIGENHPNEKSNVNMKLENGWSRLLVNPNHI